MNRFAFYVIITTVAVGAYMLYVHHHQQQQPQQQLGQTAPAATATDRNEGFEPSQEQSSQAGPVIVPELPPVVQPPPQQPRYGPRAFANSGGRISVSVGAVQDQPHSNNELFLGAPPAHAPIAPSWGSAKEWAGLLQDVSDIKQAVSSLQARATRQPTVYETYF